MSDWANGYVIYGEKPDLSDGKKVWCGGYRMTAMDNEVVQVRLTGLKPATLYYYKIGADRIEYKDGYHIRITGNEEKAQVYSFRTAGKEAKAHFCVINDTHASWKAINPTINKIMELQPSCVIWNGDACNTEETVAAQKRIFFKPEIDRKDLQPTSLTSFVLAIMTIEAWRIAIWNASGCIVSQRNVSLATGTWDATLQSGWATSHSSDLILARISWT